jgi:hypothetical protein
MVEEMPDELEDGEILPDSDEVAASKLSARQRRRQKRQQHQLAKSILSPRQDFLFRH